MAPIVLGEDAERYFFEGKVREVRRIVDISSVDILDDLQLDFMQERAAKRWGY